MILIGTMCTWGPIIRWQCLYVCMYEYLEIGVKNCDHGHHDYHGDDYYFYQSRRHASTSNPPRVLITGGVGSLVEILVIRQKVKTSAEFYFPN